MGKDSQYNMIIALLGKSAAGKDALARKLAKHGFKYIVSTTTRPMRSNEQDHVDYHFISEEDFLNKFNNGEFVEHRAYDTIENGRKATWFYGVEWNEIDLENSSCVCVVDTIGLEDLEKEYGNQVLPIYIEANEEVRRERAMMRNKNFEIEEWERREKDDRIKFKDIENKAEIISNNNSIDECLEKLLWCIEYVISLRKFYTQYASY